jgi:hypothetical protein
VLLETEADFCIDTDHSLHLYAEALQTAMRHNHPISSICLSYAALLIDNGLDTILAKKLLELSRDGIYAAGDTLEIRAHKELIARLTALRQGST